MESDTQVKGESDELLVDFAKKILASYEGKTWDKQELLDKYLPEDPYVPRTFSQDWIAYDKAKTNEDVLFKRILDELLTMAIPRSFEKKRGRPSFSPQERILAMCIKIYYRSDLRKATSILKELKNLGLIRRVPSFKSIDNFFNDKRLSALLDRLIFLTALPLSKVEETGAIDSTGFSTSEFARWVDYKWGKPTGKERVWIKAHASVGCKTNTFLSVEVTRRDVGDNRMLQKVVGNKPKYFSMKDYVADKAYSSRETLKFLDALGLNPYIPFKKNTTGKSGGVAIWRKMWLEFTYREKEFMRRYHLRSNVETCFAMVKMRFGSSVKMRTFKAQVNEIKSKVLCHNICVLIQEMYELGIEVDFEQGLRVVESASMEGASVEG